MLENLSAGLLPGSGYPLQVLARASLRAFRYYPSRMRHLRMNTLTMMLFVGIVFTSLHLTAQSDTSTSFSKADTSSSHNSTKKVKEPIFTYYRIGIDVSKIAMSFAQQKYKVFEAQADVFYKQNLYFNVEFGYGSSVVDNDFLKYKSNNSFLRLGMDKTFFSKDFKGDFDNASVGVRYGIGLINRGDGTYATHDIVWGNSSGVVEGASFMVHWLELTGGFRLEIMKNIFIGWTGRAKTFINPKKFEKLPPSYVAGYGRGDKNTAFGYNFYVLLGLGKR